MHVFKRFYIHRLFALALCLGQTIFIHAQMTNGGFEQNSSLPSALGQFFKAQGWGNANSSVGSPDYFHYAGNNATDLPETPMALVNSFSGSAAMGMIVCGRNGMNIREYLTYTFPTPMVPGQKYVVRFNVTNGDRTSVSNAGLGVDQIGIYFADAPVNQNGYDPIIATPDYRIEEVFYSKVWKSYSFVYEATSAKQQLVFGLFGACILCRGSGVLLGGGLRADDPLLHLAVVVLRAHERRVVLHVVALGAQALGHLPVHLATGEDGHPPRAAGGARLPS
jgi:hypothetical protein